MRLPSNSDLSDFNHILYKIYDLTHAEGTCSTSILSKAINTQCFGGRVTNVKKILNLLKFAGLIYRASSEVGITTLGQQFIARNPDRFIEIQDSQKQWLVNEMFLSSTWESRTRSFLRNFYPNYEKVTFQYDWSEENTQKNKFNDIANLLIFLDVIQFDNRVLSIKPNYVALVRNILALSGGLSQEELDEALQVQKDLGNQGEDAVLRFEKRRLERLGRNAEAPRVRKISQLNVTAGYDIESFNGDKPSVDHDRFIEVKSSAGPEIRFFWSDNQFKIAQSLREHYWIYFLRSFESGKHEEITPIMIQDPANQINESENFVMAPKKYLVICTNPNIYELE